MKDQLHATIVIYRSCYNPSGVAWGKGGRMMSGGQSSMRSAGSFDPRCLGYGVQWGMRLTLLFADTLFVGRANRGADSFCDALMLATIAVYAVMFLLCRKRDESQPLTSRFLNRSCLAQVALIVCGLVLIVLASFVEQFQVASIAAGICLGCGMGLAVYEWVYLFMRRGAMAARQSLVASWLLGVGIFALLALVPSLLRLILLCVLGIASVALELGYARTTHGLDASESGASQDSTLERRAGADGHGTTRELRQFAPIAVAATVLGFAYGMSGPLQLSGGGASTGDAALLANHVGTALIAALVASLILFASVGRLNLLPVFLAAFTLDTTAAIALPFAGDGYFPLCASIFGMVNRVAGMLVLYSCVTLPNLRIFYRVAPFLLGASSLGLTAGVAIGNALFASIANGYVVLMVVTLAIMYVMFVALTVALVTRGWRGEPIANATMPASSPAEKPASEADSHTSASEIASLYGLSEREVEVMGYLSKGRGVSFTAEQLGLSQNTVKAYAKSLYKKLDVHSREELIDLVDEFGRN